MIRCLLYIIDCMLRICALLKIKEQADIWKLQLLTKFKVESLAVLVNIVLM